MTVRRRERKAISPIVATVLIVAATLIAFAATAGYVFGIFGSAGNTANVAATGSTFTASTWAGGVATALTATCATTQTNPSVSLSNTGTASATVTSVLLTFAGQNPSAAATGGAACAISAGGTLYLNLSAYKTGTAGTPSSGQSYTGTVTLNNGAQVTFAGTFQ